MEKGIQVIKWTVPGMTEVVKRQRANKLQADYEALILELASKEYT
jgi:hypothetical protein